MANEVGTVFGGNVAMPKSSALAAALRDSSQRDPRGGGVDGAEYLNFSGKRGVYTVGSEGKEFDKDAMVVPNIAGFQDGWVCWKGGQPVATRLANISAPAIATPNFDEFGPFDTKNGEGWFQAKATTFKDIDTGDQFYFKINSVSGVSALAGLLSMIAERAERSEAAWPVLKLGMEAFTSRGFKNYKPKFEVVGWLDDENVAKLFGEEDYDLDDLFAASEGVSPEGGNDEEEEDAPAPAASSRRQRRKL